MQIAFACSCSCVTEPLRFIYMIIMLIVDCHCGASVMHYYRLHYHIELLIVVLNEASHIKIRFFLMHAGNVKGAKPGRPSLGEQLLIFAYRYDTYRSLQVLPTVLKTT